MTGIATRGLLVTGAPAVFSVAAEYDDGRIKHALDQGAYMHSKAILVYPLESNTRISTQTLKPYITVGRSRFVESVVGVPFYLSAHFQIGDTCSRGNNPLQGMTAVCWVNTEEHDTTRARSLSRYGYDRFLSHKRRGWG